VPIQQPKGYLMKQHLITAGLLGLLVMTTVALQTLPVKAANTVPQTQEEKAQNVERVKLPCIGSCDPKHYMYILREVN